MTNAVVAATTPAGRPTTRGRRLLGSLARYRPRTFTQALGLIVVAAWVILAIGAPVFSGADPIGQNISVRLQPPSAAHLFGTDTLGRDLLSRVLYGGRITIPIGVSIMILTLLIGVPIGALAAYVGGWFDEVLMRFADIFLAFPTLVLALAIAAALGPTCAARWSPSRPRSGPGTRASSAARSCRSSSATSSSRLAASARRRGESWSRRSCRTCCRWSRSWPSSTSAGSRWPAPR